MKRQRHEPESLHIIKTDVVGFENFLQSNKDKIHPELLAAKICGRWRNGVPLALSPETDSPPGGIPVEKLNDYEYVNPDGSGDPKGLRCPVGAHMRRINPRGQPVTGQGQPGGSNNTHRLIRRGIESAENPRFGASADTPENQTVSATALWEQCAVSPRAD